VHYASEVFLSVVKSQGSHGVLSCFRFQCISWKFGSWKFSGSNISSKTAFNV